MTTKRTKKRARAIQRYTGAGYMTCLRWAEALHSEGLVMPKDNEAAVRIALHLRFPDITIERDDHV